MNKLNCLIIEDEPIAAEVLKDYIDQIAFLHLKEICTDAILALDFLRRAPIDVLFLDIHLPKLKGLDFLKTLQPKPQTILTTAYHEYALDAFDLGVVDYLMKPIGFPRFLKAINKLDQDQQPIKQIMVPKELEAKRPFHFFNVNKKMVKVFIDEILYIESLKDYSRIFTIRGGITTRMQIGEVEILLKAHNFLRIHRSFIVALDQIQAYSATSIEIEQKSLPIGRSYKELVSKILKNFST